MSRCLLFKDDQLWVRHTDAGVEYLFEATPAGSGGAAGRDGLVAACGSLPQPARRRSACARSSTSCSPKPFALAGLGRQLLNWRLTHRFCGACGQPLVRHATERAMHCAACGLTVYPRVNPVVIVLISRGDRILLAHKAGGQFAFWSVVAGFVEANETLEHAVEREIAEEVGLRVKNIRYLSSQAWPFPNNLMLGFAADYESGEVRPDGVEIDEAGWFGRDDLPPLPTRFSIASAHDRHLLRATPHRALTPPPGTKRQGA